MIFRMYMLLLFFVFLANPCWSSESQLKLIAPAEIRDRNDSVLNELWKLTVKNSKLGLKVDEISKISIMNKKNKSFITVQNGNPKNPNNLYVMEHTEISKNKEQHTSTDEDKVRDNLTSILIEKKTKELIASYENYRSSTDIHEQSKFKSILSSLAGISKSDLEAMLRQKKGTVSKHN